MRKALEAAILCHLVDGKPAPRELAGLPQAELALLRALCRGSAARGAVAADGLAALVGGGAERGRGGAPVRRAADYTELLNAGEGVGEGGGVRESEGGGLRPVDYTELLNADVGVREGVCAGADEGRGVREGVGVASRWRDGLDEVRGAVLTVQALEEELAVFAPLLGMGWHRAGTALFSVVLDRLGDLRRVLARAPELRRLADLLGRQRQGLTRGVGAERGGRVTAVGVKVGGGLEDALASELALLADPMTEDLFLTRLLERRLVSLEMTGDDEGEPARPRRRRGPAIVLVDTSGSMMGSSAELAKAVVLAVVERLSAERRAVEVAIFGGEGSMKTTRFAERKTSPRELFDFLMTSFHGGTDFDGPLAWALDRQERTQEHRESGKLAEADLLLVTDGRARLKTATKDRLRAARRAGLQLFVAYIDHGLGFDPRGFEGLADQVAIASTTGLRLLPAPTGDGGKGPRGAAAGAIRPVKHGP